MCYDFECGGEDASGLLEGFSNCFGKCFINFV